MLDILWFLLAAIGLAVLALVGRAAMLPTTFRIERTRRIEAPPEHVFPLINDLEAMNRWNPFAKGDPKLRIIYAEPSAGKGAAYDWDSTGRGGRGRLEITDVNAPSAVKLLLVMTKPFACKNVVDFTLHPAGTSATDVTWAMNGPWPLLHRVMHLLFNSDKMVGGEFEKGLEALKLIAESEKG